MKRLNLLYALTISTLILNPAQGQDVYPEPDPPVAIDVQGFALLDAEVDSYIRVVRARDRFGVTGSGLTVAVIDSGINTAHVDFQGKLVPGKNFSTAGGDSDVMDTNGHGSNVAGIIAGKNVTKGGMHTGIAFDANIAALKVFPGGQFSRINNALQWVLDNAVTQHISVVNMSLGNSANVTNDSGITFADLATQRELISQLRANNIAVVVSAGNGYFSSNSQQGMSMPGIFKDTISVGAIYDTDIQRNPDNSPLVSYVDGGTVNFAVQNRCTVFSQRLGSQVGGEFRTDIFSPGFIVTSAGPVKRNNDGTIDSVGSARSETTQDGTSQAGPVVAGVVLLLQERFQKINATLGRPANELPPVALIESCIFNGGTEFVDVEDDIAMQMDNVIACGATFRSVDALGALVAMDESFRGEVMRTQAAAFTNAKGLNTLTPTSINKANLFKGFKEGQR